MPQMPFQGAGYAVSSDGLARVANSLGVFGPEVWTVVAVETSGCGYLPDRRPLILFERHIFHRLTGGQFDDGSISDPTPGGYGAGGANQYERLGIALAKDRNAALQSASWGIGQIMGENYAAAGFQSVEEMTEAMSQSEDVQLTAMGRFLISTGLDTPLRAHNWASFARGYNGSNYAFNRYDIRLNGEFQRFSVSGLPDFTVRAAQLYLTYLGFHPGPIDGIAGEQTLSTLAQFQTQGGLKSSETVDGNALGQLTAALA